MSHVHSNTEDKRYALINKFKGRIARVPSTYLNYTEILDGEVHAYRDPSKRVQSMIRSFSKNNKVSATVVHEDGTSYVQICRGK